MNFSKHLGNGLHLASLAFFAIDLFGKTQSWPVLLAYSVCHSIRSYGWVMVDIQTMLDYDRTCCPFHWDPLAISWPLFN